METNTEVTESNQGKQILNATEYIDFVNQFNAPAHEANLAAFVESKYEDLKMCLVFGRDKEQVEERMNKIVKACNEYDKLKSDNELLLNALKELLRFNSVMENASDNLQYPDNYLKAIEDCKEAIKQVENK